jgi:xanthine dehydrogenase YagS FAD-binding subunit
MRPFLYERAATADAAFEDVEAAHRAAAASEISYLAGGTTLLDLMKLDVMRPSQIIDINPLQSSAYGRIEINHQGLRLGALARMSDAAENPDIKHHYPALAQSLQLAASAQIRNMASLGGNVLQRTRCTYFRDVSYRACNKRSPGTGCAAITGFNRMHAVLGTSDDCIAAYPGDFAVALTAFDATVEIANPDGRRFIPFTSLHRKPANTPDKETNLRPGELIAAFIIPAAAWMRRSLYLKIRDRESYEFALASAAVALDQRDGHVRDVRIALGGVATVPWRSLEAEGALRGKAVNDRSLAAAAEAAFADARGFGQNDFKIALGKRTLSRAVRQAAALEI